MIKSAISILLQKATGLKLVNPTKWRVKYNFENLKIKPSALKLVTDNTMINEARLVNIQEVVQYIVKNQIKGSYVECGVWKGGSVAFAANQLLSNRHNIPLHLFDAFDDICQPDATVDGERAIQDVGGLQNASGKLEPIKGVYNKLGGHGMEAEVNHLLVNQMGYPQSLVNVYKGWFQDTLPLAVNTIGPIAVLRLDGDWYSSTKVCLDYLFDLVTSGGIIIIDDYGCYEGCKKAVDEFLASRNLDPFLIKVDDECVYFIK